MNRNDHAFHARQLVDACGGPSKAAEFCRVQKSQLSDYASANGRDFMPADVMHELEAYIGRPIYSRALAEALCEAPAAKDLAEEACEATEEVGALQQAIRLALKKGPLTPNQRAVLRALHARAEDELRDVGQRLADDS